MSRRSRQQIFGTNIEVSPLVRLWLLRLLVPLGMQQSLINEDGFNNPMLAEAIGLDKQCELTGKEVDRAKIRAALQKLHRECEEQHPAPSVPECLAENIERLSKMVTLSEADRRIIEFAVLLHSEGLLSDLSDRLGELPSNKTFRILAVILDIPESEIRTAFSGQGNLTKSGLVLIDRKCNCPLIHKIELLSSGFADLMVSSEIDTLNIIRDRVSRSSPASLNIDAYAHIGTTLKILLPYLAHSFEKQRAGVNIFVHGAPGTGKNELAKLLAKETGCELFEVANQDEDGEPLYGEKRLRALFAAQSFFSHRHAMILFDEAEDVFNDSGLLSRSTAQTHKAWVNRALEDNLVPTIWLSNANRLDPAFVRRFDMFFELPSPPKKQRQNILQAACGDYLDAATSARIVEADNLTPAVIARAASVIRSLEGKIDKSKLSGTIQHLVSSTLEGQGYRPILQNDSNRLPDTYDSAFIHSDVDLNTVAAGLATSKSGRLCLYGPPGTGKTAFGRWLAEQLDSTLLVKRGSDLISMWCGETEKNIAKAFREAELEKAILLIDEVDGFLQDRRGAKQSWEITSVNEMLTQMESFSGIFIASTNLMDSLDQAALRRFDLKVKFDYLKPEQSWQLLLRHCESLNLATPTSALQAEVSRLCNLTPGDFAAVVRQHRFRPVASAAELISALKRECEVKENGNRMSIGFH